MPVVRGPNGFIDLDDLSLIPDTDDAATVGLLTRRYRAVFSRMLVSGIYASGVGATVTYGAESVGIISGTSYAVPGATAQLDVANPVNERDSGNIVAGNADAELAGGSALVQASGLGSKALGSARAETAHAAILRATGNYSFAGGVARANGFASTLEATGEASLAFGYSRPTFAATQLRATNIGAVALGISRYGGDLHASGPGSFAQGDAYGYQNSSPEINASGFGSMARGLAVGEGRILATMGGSTAMGYPTNLTAGAGVPTIQATGSGALAGGSVTASDYAATIEASGPGALAWGRSAQDPGKLGPTILRATNPGSVAMGVSYDENATLDCSGDGSMVVGVAISYGASVATLEAISPTANGSWVGGFCGAAGGYTARLAVEENGAWAFGKLAAVTANRNLVSSEEGALAHGRAQDGSIYASGFGSRATGHAGGGYAITASGDGAMAHGSTTTGNIEATYPNSVQFGPGTNAAADEVQIGSAGLRFKGTTGVPVVLQNGDFWVNSGSVYVRTGGVTKNLDNVT